MSLSHHINAFRRKLTKRLTNHFGKNQSVEHFKSLNPLKVKQVLISRPNQRLGNLILLTPLIQEVETIFPNAKIDIVVKGNLAPILFKNYKSIDRIIELPKKPFSHPFLYIFKWYSVRFKIYDVAINPVKDSSSGKLLTALSRADYKFFGQFSLKHINENNDVLHIAKQSIYQLHQVMNLKNESSNYEIPNLKLRLSAEEICNGKKTLDHLNENHKPTIAIYTYATGNKCHSKVWWEDFFSQLKQSFVDFNILEILPLENVSQINFKSKHYYSKNLRELAALLLNTEIFIGADSGMMHLASASGTKNSRAFFSNQARKV